MGTLLKKGIRLRESIEQDYSTPGELQKQQLKKLMIHARDTEFGKHYRFDLLLREFKKGNGDYYRAYASGVPIYDYEKMYAAWWYRLREGAKNITWPGAIRYFALTSGTSGASSKYIPITRHMVQ